MKYAACIFFILVGSWVSLSMAYVKSTPQGSQAEALVDQYWKECTFQKDCAHELRAGESADILCVSHLQSAVLEEINMELEILAKQLPAYFPFHPVTKQDNCDIPFVPGIFPAPKDVATAW